MSDEPHFPCSHCGEEHPVSVYTVEQYAGRTITRWCSKCSNLFDVEMPPRGKDSG
jgi:transcription elongation factor Elf1